MEKTAVIHAEWACSTVDKGPVRLQTGSAETLGCLR